MSREHVMALSPGERILTVKAKISISAFLMCTAIVAHRNLLGPTEFPARHKYAICKEQLKIILDGFLAILVLFIFLLS